MINIFLTLYGSSIVLVIRLNITFFDCITLSKLPREEFNFVCMYTSRSSLKNYASIKLMNLLLNLPTD